MAGKGKGNKKSGSVKPVSGKAGGAVVRPSTKGKGKKGGY